MNISKYLVCLLLGVPLLVSCEAVRINEYADYKSSEFVFGSNKTAVLVGNNNILISEFTKTFNKKYKEKQDFIKQYDSLCVIALKKENLFGEISINQSFESVSNDPMTFTQEQQRKVDSLFANTTADYLIRISDHQITNSIQGNPAVPMTTSSGGMTMSGGQSESCIINSHFQIYDINSRKKVLDFVSIGSGSVLFFAFEQALVDAMNSSVKNSSVYLKTGKLKF